MDVVKFVASEYKVGKIELDKYSHDMDASVKLLSEKDLILHSFPGQALWFVPSDKALPAP